MRSLLLRGLALAVLLAGCVTDDELETAQVGQEAGGVGGCTPVLCGENSAICGGFPFYELDQTGTVAAPGSGLRITSFSKANIQLDVRVIGARLTGRTPWGGVIENGALAGAVLVVENAAGVGFQIRIDTVTVPPAQPYWELGDDGTLLETYAMKVKPVLGGKGRWENLCPIAAPSNLPQEPWQLPPYHALIFRGDRYDAATGEVIATGDAVGPWFNIACAGDRIAKAGAIRHAEFAQATGFLTTPAQRTTAIRMFGAAYCGAAGEAYTETGIAIDWANIGGWNELEEDAEPWNVEAIWKDGKAVCLNNPRFISLNDVAALPCPMVACSPDQIDNWTQYGDFITIIP
jgi:hypothetical protein